MKNYRNGEKGYILYMSLVFVGLISMIAGVCFFVTTSDYRMSTRSADSIRAYYVADAGLANVFMQVRAGAAGTITASDSSYSVGSSMIGSYTTTATSDGAQFPTYTIVSQGTYRNVTKTLTLRVKASSFSRYGYFSGTEIDPVWGGNWYITGMISTGPTHTNGRFNMWGAPVFSGVVSQVASAVNYWNSATDNPDYQQGLNVSAPALALPVTNTFLNSISAGAQQAQGLYLTGDSTLTFVSDGTINVTNTANGWTNHSVPIPANNALFVNNGNATVQGVLNGRLTVGTNQNIYINGNLVYNLNPRTNPSSTDLLGLVAKTNVQVTDQGPFSIEVDGYIVALDGQFSVKNFWTFAKGDMVQYGGLTTKLPGGLTGLFDPGTGQVVFGYNQLQYFDERLKNEAPPWFPPATDSAGRVLYNKLSLTEM